ncbi:MAG: hypothetical protein LW808_002345 [Verrucomicrobiota bacterium]|nr:MAG: hypothetical protein LW808_002345 [Verrucomicrobiota bacterium]
MSINGLKPSNPPATPSITGVPQETKASKAESTAPKPFAFKIGQGAVKNKPTMQGPDNVEKKDIQSYQS